jgi:hypothetical protein
MFRRTFLTKTVAASFAAWASVPNLSAQQTFLKRKKMIIPAKIRTGATVALIAPASPPTLAKIEKAPAS